MHNKQTEQDHCRAMITIFFGHDNDGEFVILIPRAGIAEVETY